MSCQFIKLVATVGILLRSVAPVAAAKNEIKPEYRDHLRKYIPLLRLPEFNLPKAADYLEAWKQVDDQIFVWMFPFEAWAQDTLPAKPFLDVSASEAEST
jgi:hypothetical protein